MMMRAHTADSGLCYTFLRARGLLQEIMTSEEFMQMLWEFRTPDERARRQENYINVIGSGAISHNVKDIHNVFYHIRAYFRRFDGDDA